MKRHAATACVLAFAFSLIQQNAIGADGLTPVPMARIPAGVSFDKTPPRGWSNIISFVEGRLGQGDVEAASATVANYAKMFNLVMLANVAKDDSNAFYLEKIAIGWSMKINGKNTVITSATQAQLGGNLDFIGRSVFSANETALDKIVQVARFSTIAVLDAPAVMLHNGEHREMVVRYLVWVSSTQGSIHTMAWLLDRDPNGRYAIVHDTFQLLPPNFREDRVMNVKGDKFTFGIPSKDAFAIVKVPQGTPYKFTNRMRQFAGQNVFTKESFVELIKTVNEALSQGAANQQARRAQ